MRLIRTILDILCQFLAVCANDLFAIYRDVHISFTQRLASISIEMLGSLSVQILPMLVYSMDSVKLVCIPGAFSSITARIVNE